MNILTPTQYEILAFAWKTKVFTIDEINASEISNGRKPPTIRNICDTIVQKGFMKYEKKKGSYGVFSPTVTKQDYYILMAKTWFGNATEDEKAFFKWAMDQA